MFKIDKHMNHLHITASGKLTHDDYEKFLIPKLEDAIRQYGKLKLVIEMVEFDGWELQAAWDDFKTGIQNRKNFEKIAIIGDKKWQKFATDVFSVFISGEIEFFNQNEKELAENWING